MGFKFQPNEVLAAIAGCCLNAYFQSKGMTPEMGNALEAVTEGTIKGFSFSEKPSPALDHLHNVMTQSVEQALQTAGLDYMDYDFENLLLEQAFSPQAVRDYLTSENPSAKLEENIRAAAETSETYDGNTLPVPRLANSLLEYLYEAIQNDPTLAGLTTLYNIQEIRASLARQQSVSDFERMLSNMRPASEFRSPNPLHYLNKDLTFQGRAYEFHWLDQFRDSSQPLLYAFVQGGGGVGKSRLLHEYVIRHRNDGDWYLCFLCGQAVETLPKMDSYVCSRHAFLVIDYASQNAEILGKWISRLAETQNLPHKIRVILIERQATREFLRLGSSEFWISRFYGSSHQERVLQEVEYSRLTLQQLDKSALFQLMDDYSVKVAKKEALSQEVKERILIRTQTELGIEPEHQTPLFVLLATDAFLNCGSIKNWDIHLLTKNYVGRMLEHWEKTLCGNDKELYRSLFHMILFATASGGMDLNAAAAPELAEDVDRILRSPACREILGNSSGLYGDLLLPLKPDYIGEFLFLQYLSELFPMRKRQAFLNALYVKPMEFAAFFAKCVQDFAHAEMFCPLFQNILEAIRPMCPTAESYAAYASMVMSISMTCKYGEINTYAAVLEKLLYEPLIKESAYFLYTGVCFLKVLLHMTYIDGYDVIPSAELSRIAEQRKASIPCILEKMWAVCRLFGDKDTMLIPVYAEALANYSIYGTYQEAEACAEKLHRLYTKYTAAQSRISLYYAMALNNILFKLSLSPSSSQERLAEGTLAKIAKLYKKHAQNLKKPGAVSIAIVNAISAPELRESADEQIQQFSAMMNVQRAIAVEYAKALNNITSTYAQNSSKEAFRHFRTLKKLYIRHKTDQPLVMVEYAKSMVALIIICSKEDADRLVHTLSELRDSCVENKAIYDLMTVRYAKLLSNRLAIAVSREESGEGVDQAFDEMTRICRQPDCSQILQLYFINALHHRFILQFKRKREDDCQQIIEELEKLACTEDKQISSAAQLRINELLNSQLVGKGLELSL